MIVAAVPTDRDIATTYRLMAAQADHLILTSSERNITIRFPDESTALAAAQAAVSTADRYVEIAYAPDIASALPLALSRAGDDGTVLLSLSRSQRSPTRWPTLAVLSSKSRHYNRPMFV
ncbi:MAG: hypothetical protein HND48_05295 [Chloroflexi bacterium]|nr:hypothetical protein [Chloroflexota bacterium]